MFNNDTHLTNLIDHLKPGDQVSSPPEPRREQEIMGDWRAAGKPLVSICCATFNHAAYLKDALNGFLCQRASFPFEIIIRDDASTDGTTEIVQEYARRYPSIVHAVIETENQFKKGIRAMHVWPSLARGEFVALCEGDDFWLDVCKLQKQVELLQQHPEAVMSVAKTLFCRQEDERLLSVRVHHVNENALQDFEDVKRNYFHTSTYVIRRKILIDVVSKFFSGHGLFGDTALRSVMVSYGPFAYLPEVVSVYRQTGSGIWASLSLEKQLLWEIGAAEKLSRMLEGKHKRHQQEKLLGFYVAIFGVCRSKLIAALKAGRVGDGIALLPRVLRYGVALLPRVLSYGFARVASYARSKFRRVE